MQRLHPSLGLTTHWWKLYAHHASSQVVNELGSLQWIHRQIKKHTINSSEAYITYSVALNDAYSVSSWQMPSTCYGGCPRTKAKWISCSWFFLDYATRKYLIFPLTLIEESKPYDHQANHMGSLIWPSVHRSMDCVPMIWMVHLVGLRWMYHTKSSAMGQY